jgi:DNA-binding XRE family transcriptional regulator
MEERSRMKGLRGKQALTDQKQSSEGSVDFTAPRGRRVGKERITIRRNSTTDRAADIEATNLLFKDVEKKTAADPVLALQMKALRDEARLALKLADLRKESGLTQADLARKLGCTQPQVARMERKGYLGTIRSVAQFAAACGKKLIIDFK